MKSNPGFMPLINSLVLKYKYILGLYIVLQIVFILFFPREYRNDAQYYYSLAQECVHENQFYPAEKHLYEDYLVAPLYVNILVILLKVYNSHLTIGIFNIIINLLQLLLIYKITLFYSNNKTAKLSVLIYIFYLNTCGLVLLNYTELLFTFFILASIFYYLKKTTTSYLSSGILLGASIAVRPVGWNLILCLLLLAIAAYFKEKKINFDFLKVISGTLLFIILFGSFNYAHFGRFIFTSSTGPVNLLLGANDTATGGFNAKVYEKGNIGYLAHPDTMTYIQKGDFYFKQATNWIKENPGRWLLLAPFKLIHTFSYDDISLAAIVGLGDWNFYTIFKHLASGKSFNNILLSEPFYLKVIYFLIELTQHIYYYFLVFVLIMWVIKNIKDRSFSEYSILHSLFVLLGILMILITVGTPRYKYPFVIVMIPFIASYIQTKYLNRISIDK